MATTEPTPNREPVPPAPTPSRDAGVVLVDDGDAAERLADFLESRGFIQAGPKETRP